MSKAVLYYTCNTHDLLIEEACRKQLVRCIDMGLYAVSLKKIDFGDWNIVVPGKRSPETMHKQILLGLERIREDYVFFAESDVLYHPSHFDFEPPRDDTFFFNTNVWKVRYPDGHAYWTDDLQQLSGLCASHDLLLDFYRSRVAKIESDGFDRHYEPGRKVGDYLTCNWVSKFPNIDIRHNKTQTRTKWFPDDFRNKRYAKGWQEASEIKGWGVIEGHLVELLEGGMYNGKE